MSDTEPTRDAPAAVHDPLAELDVRVGAVDREAHDVVSLTLERTDGGPLPTWDPGAHIDVLLGDTVGERQYSLCGDPADRHSWRIGVLRERDGRGGSSLIHDTIAAGDLLRVRGPRNNFELVPAAAYIFVAGGIGITPLLPMIASVSAARDAGWTLHYGGRSRSSMAFVDELAAYGERVTLWPQDEHGLLALDVLLGDPEPDTAIYCCGPEPLIEAVEQRCAAGWPHGALHVERFHPRPGALDGPSEGFEVMLDRTGLTVAVAPDQTIVEALESAGVDVPTSCREGTCGTCETEVLEGEIDHRDSFLSDDERADGATMMICCSRARSERLVLDL